MTIKTLLNCGIVVLALAASATQQAKAQGPLSWKFTYQGQLKYDDAPVTGDVDMMFSLWDSAQSGIQMGPTLTFDGQENNPPSVDLTDGVFTVELDFGAGLYDGDARYLEIAVRYPPGSGSYVTLAPRQALTATPFALWSMRPWATGADAALYYMGGKVSIGTTSPSGTLTVTNSGNVHAIWAETSRIPVYAHRTSTSGTWPAVHGECDSQTDEASGVRGVITSTNPGWLSAGVYGSNHGLTFWDGVGVRGEHGGTGSGVYGHAPTGSGVAGYSEEGNGTSGVSDNGIGVWGTSAADVGVKGEGGTAGGYFYHSTDSGEAYLGYTDSSDDEYGVYGTGNYAGVYGEGTGGGESISVGVKGIAHQPDAHKNYGVYGSARYASVDNYAGYFVGDLRVQGNVTKTSGSFEIDHPLDPANKYLYHSFVESPDMMNVYNGNVALDENGEAVITMPEWFGALNRDFRYQLTPIGAPAPNLYVAEEVNDNSFRIAGGTPGLRVSWQVTGIRQDPWANANRIQVEVDKPAMERGSYLHPELYNAPESRRVDVWVEATAQRAARRP
jgi:hypothetical protein